jgi:hypothetical protein
MQLVRQLRVPALVCSLAVLACELIARPHANIGICDDGPYILMAKTLAATGHIAYNGCEAAMLVAQIYLAAAFIKLFGFSFTIARASTILVAMVIAFVVQRTLVRANISERNATIGTLALVLSPLYLLLSATFMSDIFGLFAIVLCLYGCLRALQASSNRAVIAWLSFAVLTNCLCGTSRQIAWLGALVMVPSALWLLRSRRSVLLPGALANLLGALFILACILWSRQQPYLIPVSLLVKSFPVTKAVLQLALLLLGIPFLLLPIAGSFLPQLRKIPPAILTTIGALFLIYSFLAIYPSHLRGDFRAFLEPTTGGPGSWITTGGLVRIFVNDSGTLSFLPLWLQFLFTVIAYAGIAGLAVTWLRSSPTSPHIATSSGVSWQKLLTLLVPFGLAYLLLLIATIGNMYVFFDRYSLGLLLIALIVLVRLYQERIQLKLSFLSISLVVLMAIYGIAATSSNFSFYRARITLADELHLAGLPSTSIDNGWDANFDVELEHANHVNDARIHLPANAYTPVPPLPAHTCPMFWHDKTPHIHPIYAVSFDPSACYGPAPFAPVHFSRWPASQPGTLYVVRSIPPQDQGSVRSTPPQTRQSTNDIGGSEQPPHLSSPPR